MLLSLIYFFMYVYFAIGVFNENEIDIIFKPLLSVESKSIIIGLFVDKIKFNNLCLSKNKRNAFNHCPVHVLHRANPVVILNRNMFKTVRGVYFS